MQTALRELVSRAGLQLLEPAPDDPVDPEFHFVINTVRGNGRTRTQLKMSCRVDSPDPDESPRKRRL